VEVVLFLSATAGQKTITLRKVLDMKKLQVGSTIRDIGGIEGVILSIKKGSSVENHGTIEVRITKIPKQQKYVSVGDIEHYVHYDWQNYIRVIE
jgi:preprotein translocase subunit YajC